MCSKFQKVLFNTLFKQLVVMYVLIACDIIFNIKVIATAGASIKGFMTSNVSNARCFAYISFYNESILSERRHWWAFLEIFFCILKNNFVCNRLTRFWYFGVIKVKLLTCIRATSNSSHSNTINHWRCNNSL